MVEYQDIQVLGERGKPPILKNLSGDFAAGRMHAIVGPSGCGKTTLLRALLGLVPSKGKVWIDGKESANPANKKLTPGQRLGFVPQFSIAHEDLTVREALYYTAQLMFGRKDAATTIGNLETLISETLELVGLLDQNENAISELSGGQRRRLGLALELVRKPKYLFCDEVTSGLDPRSENQILAILRGLVEDKGITVICVIHNLAQLPQFDSVTVLSSGAIAFSGPWPQLQRQYSLSDPLFLYDKVEERPPVEADNPVGFQKERADAGRAESGMPPIGSPSFVSQLCTLLHRRFLLLGRDSGYMILWTALTLGFPFIVVIFALKGLPQIEGLALERNGTFLEELQANLRYQIESAETASLVTGLIMFQVVLLTLMGANNGSREIADERVIFEKERMAGLRLSAFVVSKLLFTGGLAVVQGLWMTIFVKIICQFPGPFLEQAGALILCCLAMTWICLGLSALLRSGDRASLLAIYLVGFQLPLSGIVLALPDALVWILRPWITAYWSWAGYFSSMKDYQVYDAYRMQDTSWMAEPLVAILVLSAQAMFGVLLVWLGSQKKRGF